MKTSSITHLLSRSSCIIAATFIVMAAAAASFAAGVPDRSFANAGTASLSTPVQTAITDVVFTSDDKMIIVAPNDYGTTNLYRLWPNGSLDSSFGAGGAVSFDSSDMRFTDALIQPDGKILLAGSSIPFEGKTDFCILRLMPDGSRDAGFGVDGRFTLNQGSQDVINNIALLPDGRIVGAGITSDEGWVESVLRVMPDGTPDTSFGGGGLELFSFSVPSTVTVSPLQQIRVLDDGRMLLGASLSVSDTFQAIGYAMAMMTADGDLDPAFGTNGSAFSFRPALAGHTTGMSMEVMPGGNIFAAYGSGVSLLTGNGSFIRDLPLEAQRTELLPDGRVLAWGEGLDFGSAAGPIKIYSQTGLVGRSALTGYPYAAPDGRIIVASIDYDHRDIVLQALLRLSSQGTRIADFDRDDRSDFGVMQNGFFRSQNSSGSTIEPVRTNDNAQVIPELSEQRKANGEVDRNTIVYAVRAGGSVPNGSYVRRSWFSSVGDYYTASWGQPGDIPTGGDFDGDAMSDMTVFRPSDGYWYSLLGQDHYMQWGAPGDKPVPADYDYDGKTDYAVYRPSTGTWWIRRSSDGQAVAFQFGTATDIPLTGDYDGDGFADYTVYRPSEGNWYQYLTTEGFRVVKFGLADDYPVPGDYDGDGRHDIAVYRAGTWYLLCSTEGFKAVTPGFAVPGETPVAVRYDQ